MALLIATTFPHISRELSSGLLCAALDTSRMQVLQWFQIQGSSAFRGGTVLLNVLNFSFP